MWWHLPSTCLGSTQMAAASARSCRCAARVRRDVLRPDGVCPCAVRGTCTAGRSAFVPQGLKSDSGYRGTVYVLIRPVPSPKHDDHADLLAELGLKKGESFPRSIVSFGHDTPGVRSMVKGQVDLLAELGLMKAGNVRQAWGGGAHRSGRSGFARSGEG